MDPLKSTTALVQTAADFNAAAAQTFVSNADRTLRHDEEQLWDEKLVEIARDRNTAFMDLQNKGLIKAVGIGDILAMWERVSNGTAPNIDMDGMTAGQDDILTFEEVGVPIPMIHKDFMYNHRQMAASERRGANISTTGIATATRLVMDQVNEIIFNGIPNFVVSGLRVYGYTTHPDRITMTIQDWKTIAETAGAATANELIVADVQKMLNALYAKSQFGPFTLYVAKNLWAALQLDYSDQKGDNTIMQRIEAFRDIDAVRPGDNLADSSIALVGLNEENVDYAVGQDLIQTQWSATPFGTRYKVWTAGAPRIKSDANKSLGIVHGTQ